MTFNWNGFRPTAYQWRTHMSSLPQYPSASRHFNYPGETILHIAYELN